MTLDNLFRSAATLVKRDSSGQQRQRRATRRRQPNRARIGLERLEERTVFSSWTFGIPSNIYTSIAGSKADAAGNLYITGQFQGTVDFDPSPSGTANLTSAGNNDIFLAKYAPDSSLMWAQRWGDSGSDRGSQIELDSNGNLYVAGSFSGTVSFGATTLVSPGSTGVWAAKLDGGTGDVVWAQGMSGSADHARIGVDDSHGSLWLAGSYSGTGTFGSYTLPNSGNLDVFAAKLDRDSGAISSVGQMGGAGMESPWGIAVDNDGNAFISGVMSSTAGGSADFDPGPGSFNVPYSSGPNAFLAKLNAAGTLGWAKGLYSSISSGSLESKVAVNGAGHVVLAMNIDPLCCQNNSVTLGTIDFDTGPGVANVTATAAITEYSANGDFVFARGYEGVGFKSVAVDAADSIYLTGSFGGIAGYKESVDLDPGPSVVNLSSAGDSDGFVARLDGVGNSTWVRRLGGNSFDLAARIAVDDAGNVFTMGRHEGTADFPTGDVLSGSGMFAMKLEQLPSGQLPFGTITGRVFSDENQNGLADDGLTVPPSTVYLDTNKNVQLDAGETSMTTYPTGMYTFNALPAGTYQVRQIVPAGWSPTVPAISVHQVTIDFSTGTDQLFVRSFGNYNLNPPTKFYVVNDGGPDRTYEYRNNGGAIENYAINNSNSAPRGAASTSAGDKVWVVDANKKVYVYNVSGGLLGSWTAGSLPGNADVQGVTVSGSSVWLVDAKGDRIYQYNGAASRTSGNQNADASFSLSTANISPTDLVTDGSSVWVLDNGSTDKVFKYTLGGTMQGSWTIAGGGGSPTGITIDPTNVSSIWIVDSATDRVYQFDAAAARASGSQSPSSSFALASGNTNPQGIADPPAPGGESLVAGDVPGSSTTAPAVNDLALVQLQDRSPPRSLADAALVTREQSGRLPEQPVRSKAVLGMAPGNPTPATQPPAARVASKQATTVLDTILAEWDSDETLAILLP